MNVRANLKNLCVVLVATLTSTLAFGQPPQAGRNFPTAPPNFSQFGTPGDAPAVAADWILQARMAVAAGNVTAAEAAARQARQNGATIGAGGDSVESVETLIRQMQQFLQGPETGVSREVYRRAFATFLTDQSAGLIPYGQLDKAEELAKQASSLRADFAATDRTPEQVLAQIAAARRVATGSATNLASQDMITDQQPGTPRRLPAIDTGFNPLASARAIPRQTQKGEAIQLLAMSRAALDRGDITGADQLLKQAEALQVPDAAYGPNDPRPWEMALEIASAQRRRFPVNTAGNTEVERAVAENNGPTGQFPVSPGVYEPTNDTTQMRTAQATQPTDPNQNPLPAPLPAENTNQPSEGIRLYQAGIQALEARDGVTALEFFRQAWQHEQGLDPATRQQLQDKLVLLQSTPRTTGPPQTPLEVVNSRQQLLRQKLYREIMTEQANARQQSARDPRGALTRLGKLRGRVTDAEVDAAAKKSLLAVVDREIQALNQYMERNQSEIELAERNSEVIRSLALDAERRQQLQEQLAKLVDDFNGLLEEGRFAEAQVVARQARELDPESTVVQNLIWKATFVSRMEEQMQIREAKEQGFYGALTSVLRSSEPFDDSRPIRYDEGTRWADISNARLRKMSVGEQELSPAEMDIYRKLKSKVSVDFQQKPLSEVLQILSKMAGVPIAIDPIGLSAEGADSETPVSLRLEQEITLRSALNLILEPLRLSYVIQNEVLRVTSEQTRSANTVVRTYDVADLVIPVPNFVPSYNTGLAGAIQAAHRALGHNQPVFNGPIALSGNNNPNINVPASASVLAQMGASGALNSLSGDDMSQPGYAPGGMGGGAMADFSTLMDLIRETIDPDSWDDAEGNGTMRPFPLSLSLVISQTEETHEKIAKLLQQLRRLQDVQITIEVRYITLNDQFYERLGMDFDFNIATHVDPDIVGRHLAGGDGPTVIVGLDQNGVTPNLDLEFRQFGFAQTIPTFGGIDPSTINRFGFAILSDIEAFFLLEAAEGDSRSNVLQAPKVTMFNGQTAFIQDQSFRPFVTSIEPVVADFAVAHRPVIVVLPEGTSLSVQAVVSSDRRYVRMTLVPFFSRIGDVEEFTYDGEETSDTGALVIDDEGNEQGRENAQRAARGTRVQLPTFVSTSVSTTVNVPDGGTIVLGGIKRLSEGRDEFGVPMLSKLPYINRLFKNVSIGRDTQSLMLMVTPRIIIQEEEELKQTGYQYEP